MHPAGRVNDHRSGVSTDRSDRSITAAAAVDAPWIAIARLGGRWPQRRGEKYLSSVHCHKEQAGDRRDQEGETPARAVRQPDCEKPNCDEKCRSESDHCCRDPRCGDRRKHELGENDSEYLEGATDDHGDCAPTTMPHSRTLARSPARINSKSIRSRGQDGPRPRIDARRAVDLALIDCESQLSDLAAVEKAGLD